MKARLRRMVARQLEKRVVKLIRHHDVKVVAVTGSVGKTSTKLAISEVLDGHMRVLVHEGNYNVDVSVPLVFFELDPPENVTDVRAWLRIFATIDRRLKQDYPYDVVVLELGADHVGEIQHFMSYLHPDIGVVTAIAPAHLELFGSIDAIAYEKMALARGSETALLNSDDERVMQESKRLKSKPETYGVESGSVHFMNITRRKDGMLSGELCLMRKVVPVDTNFVGRHSLHALAAAAAVGLKMGLSASEIADGLQSLRPFNGRMNPLPGKRGSLILDDTYNSSPVAAIAAIQTLIDIPAKRRIAILGSMNELGDHAAEGHRQVGGVCSKLDMLLTIGANANEYIATGAINAGLDPDKVHRFDSPYDAGRFLGSRIKSGDVVLAKGSQNRVFAEEAVALVMAHPADAQNKLVRQSASWIEQKHKQFEEAIS